MGVLTKIPTIIVPTDKVKGLAKFVTNWAFNFFQWFSTVNVFFFLSQILYILLTITHTHTHRVAHTQAGKALRVLSSPPLDNVGVFKVNK